MSVLWNSDGGGGGRRREEEGGGGGLRGGRRSTGRQGRDRDQLLTDKWMEKD